MIFTDGSTRIAATRGSSAFMGLVGVFPEGGRILIPLRSMGFGFPLLRKKHGIGGGGSGQFFTLSRLAVLFGI